MSRPIVEREFYHHCIKCLNKAMVLIMLILGIWLSIDKRGDLAKIFVIVNKRGLMKCLTLSR